ncbi:Nitric oxide synthase-interacting protein [Nymphon striatum]|nr:Nitric oxide synthase-interacting protein [Nymphon striatum]
MTRHARNSTAGAVYTYHERKKDTSQSGYGTQKQRLNKDAVNDFDCCCITLQPCKNPVVTNDGHVYDKEAILEYIIHQKTKYTKQMKEYEKQKNKEKSELSELAKAEQKACVENFFAKEKSIVSNPLSSFKDPKAGGSTDSEKKKTEKANQLPSFWVPCLTPQSKPTLVKKPDKAVLCPMSGKPLKMKDLTEIIFTEVKDPDDKSSLITKKNRYMCAVTHDILGSFVPSVVLKTSGKVVTQECYEKLIEKDMIDPTNGKQMTKKDVIFLQRGGTGYSTVNDKLQAKSSRPAIQV